MTQAWSLKCEYEENTVWRKWDIFYFDYTFKLLSFEAKSRCRRQFCDWSHTTLCLELDGIISYVLNPHSHFVDFPGAMPKALIDMTWDFLPDRAWYHQDPWIVFVIRPFGKRLLTWRHSRVELGKMVRRGIYSPYMARALLSYKQVQIWEALLWTSHFWAYVLIYMQIETPFDILWLFKGFLKPAQLLQFAGGFFAFLSPAFVPHKECLLEWLLVVKWEGTMRLTWSGVCLCVFLKSSSCMNFLGKQARCCIFWTFFVVQIRRYRFASGLDVDDVWSCFRIFMNLLAQIPPGILARSLRRCPGWLLLVMDKKEVEDAEGGGDGFDEDFEALPCNLNYVAVCLILPALNGLLNGFLWPVHTLYFQENGWPVVRAGLAQGLGFCLRVLTQQMQLVGGYWLIVPLSVIHLAFAVLGFIYFDQVLGCVCGDSGGLHHRSNLCNRRRCIWYLWQLRSPGKTGIFNCVVCLYHLLCRVLRFWWNCLRLLRMERHCCLSHHLSITYPFHADRSAFNEAVFHGGLVSVEGAREAWGSGEKFDKGSHRCSQWCKWNLPACLTRSCWRTQSARCRRPCSWGGWATCGGWCTWTAAASCNFTICSWKHTQGKQEHQAQWHQFLQQGHQGYCWHRHHKSHRRHSSHRRHCAHSPYWDDLGALGALAQQVPLGEQAAAQWLPGLCSLPCLVWPPCQKLVMIFACTLERLWPHCLASWAAPLQRLWCGMRLTPLVRTATRWRRKRLQSPWTVEASGQKFQKIYGFQHSWSCWTASPTQLYIASSTPLLQFSSRKCTAGTKQLGQAWPRPLVMCWLHWWCRWFPLWCQMAMMKVKQAHVVDSSTTWRRSLTLSVVSWPHGLSSMPAWLAPGCLWQL